MLQRRMGSPNPPAVSEIGVRNLQIQEEAAVGLEFGNKGSCGPLRIIDEPIKEKLTALMTGYFGPYYVAKDAKLLSEEIVPRGHIPPRFNRRGTEFLIVTRGTATINQLELGEGDVVRIDAGEVVEISSRAGCELASQVFPYHKKLTHAPYAPVVDAALLQKLKNKKVSIVVIAQDIQYHICHAISSCLTQTYPNLEIIVINDNSEDDTGARAEMMARFDPRIEVHHVNLGMNGSRRYGLEQATGDFCVMIDGDDWLNRDAIEKLLTTAQNLNSELVLFGFDHYNDKTREAWNPVYPSYEPDIDILLPKPAKDKDAREIARLNHTVWMNFFSLKLRPAALKAMRHVYQYEDLPFSLSLMQHAKNPALCNLILHHYRRERTGQSTEKWWQVLPSQKQACLKLSVEHALKQFDGPTADYYRLVLLYKIDQIINYELGMPQNHDEKHAWHELMTDIFSLFPAHLHDRLVEAGIQYQFRKAHPKKKKHA